MDWSNPLRRPPRHRSRGAAGFTLIEAILVVTVVGIAVLLAGPLALRQLTRLRIEGSGNEIISLMQQTRLRAIRDNKTYPVGVVDGDRLLGFVGVGNAPPAPDQADIDLCSADPEPELAAVAAQGNGKVVLSERGLVAHTVAPCSDYSGGSDDCPAILVAFDGTGTIDRDVRLCIEDTRGNVLQIALDAPADQAEILKRLGQSGGPYSADVWKWEWY